MIENNRYYWSHLKTKTVTVRVSPKDEPVGAVFKVGSMIDLGKGRQMVFLEHVKAQKSEGRKPNQDAVSIPFRMGNLDFVYTSGHNPIIQNVGVLLSAMYQGERVERIVTDVLCPGDLLVFRTQKGGLKMVDALRIVKEDTYVQSKAGHAI